MKLVNLQKVKDGKYLKNYELTYENKLGKEKKFELVSRHELTSKEDLGVTPSGVSIIATCKGRLLLLHEFRMGVNKTIYNLCAGMLEANESIEDCIKRELYEETGLTLKRTIKLLPPSFAAPDISDMSSYIAIIEVIGDFEDHTSANEEINADFYSKEEIIKMIDTELFSSRAQLAAYLYISGGLD